MVIAATRLHLKSFLYFVPFALSVGAVNKQAKLAKDCISIEVRKTKGFAFWTKSLWVDRDSLTAYVNSGAHKKAIPKLKIWCDEAVHANWHTDTNRLPEWEEVEQQLRLVGRLSKVNNPSARHRKGEIVLT